MKKKKKTPKSAYAMQILNNRHKYGSIQNTMELMKTGQRINFWEAIYPSTNLSTIVISPAATNLRPQPTIYTGAVNRLIHYI
jgi:hypothetical protein